MGSPMNVPTVSSSLDRLDLLHRIQQKADVVSLAHKFVTANAIDLRLSFYVVVSTEENYGDAIAFLVQARLQVQTGLPIVDVNVEN